MKKLPWNNMGFLTVLSMLAVIGLKYCVNEPKQALTYSNSILTFLLWAGVLYLLRVITRGEGWKEIREILFPCFCFLFFFTGALAAGVQLDREGAVDFSSWRILVGILIISVAFSPLLGEAMKALKIISLRLPPADTQGQSKGFSRKRYFLLTWGLLILAYMPTFIASFPGFFTYDAEWTAYVVFTEKYSAHMPVLYVVILGWLLRAVYSITRSYNAGIAIYIGAQIVILSACFSYMLSFLRSVGVKRWICNLGTVFLALCPTVSMFVCCSTKEGLFAGGMILLVTLLLEYAGEGEVFWQNRRKKTVFIMACLLILFYRKDGIYTLIPLFLCFAFFYRKDWKRWFSSIVCVFLVYVVTTQGLIFAFHFTKSPLAEMLCVPMQQLARVYTEAKEDFSEEDLETLYSLIPETILEQYNPKLADDVKVNFLADNFKADPKKYISLWVRKGLEHFDIYVNSFLMNTYGYWYPDTVLDGYRGKHTADVIYGDSSYFAFSTERPGKRMHLCPALEKFYEKISLEIYQQKLPVISMLFSVGFWHWIYLFTAVYLLARKNKKQLFALAPTGLHYLIILLGPIALVRYVLYLFFGVPLVLALLFDAESISGT